jgi:superfamily II DNA/RNA helicase
MELNELLQKALTNTGIPALNKMQEAALEVIHNHKDTLLLAPTGSGKTLAFLLPVLQRLQHGISGVQCLILSPTRELAIQIEAVWQQMSTGFKVNTCYGGHSMKTEMNNLSQPPALLIGTPGRVLDHISRKSFGLNLITTLVLDEFDKSLSMGFQEQMGDIIKDLPSLNRRILVSATDKLNIPEFLGFSEPHILNFTSEEEKSTDGLSVKLIISPEKDKIKTLFKLLCYSGGDPTLIFCNNRESAERTNQILNEWSIPSAFFHGGMDQLDREKALIKFRNGSTVFLVASDLAARGLDIPEVKNVVHYHLPFKKDDFIHRNGRTARMFAEGTAYILLHADENIPAYLEEKPEVFELPVESIMPPPAPWVTLYISGGKKDKISKMDIVGFLCQKGNIKKEDLGKIELMDFMSFVAVKMDLADEVVALVQNEKMKGKKYRIGVAR